MKKILTLAALVGITGVGVANADPATLTGVTSYSKNGVATWNITLGTGNAQWDVNTGTGVASQTGGNLKMNTKVGPNILDTIEMTGGVLSSGAAAGTTWTCTEGTFGANVGAHICGNISLGVNFTLDSVIGNSGTAVTVTLAGDDTAIGPPQSLANSFSNMTLTNVSGNDWKLSNGVVGVGGYDFFFTVIPAAVADAVDDSEDVLEATAELINVGANDVNFTDSVTITRIAPDPTQGTAVVTTGTGPAADVTITYTSDVGASGTDTFGYQITDGTNTETATVTVNILPFGANDDSASTTRGVAVPVYPARNDVGFTPDTVTVTPGVCTSGTGTIAVTSGNGGPKQDLLITYTPPANNPAAGSATTLNDSCAYTIGNGVQVDDTANILVAVTNSVPVANDGNASAISTAGAAPAGLTATFTSPGTGGSLGNAGVTTAGNGTHGTTSVAGNVITYTITDASFFTGSDTFTYTVTDADGAASDEVDTGTVTVTIANVAPTIADRAITTDVDTASTGNALTITAGNGSPAQHTLAVTTDGDHGNCTLSAPNATGTLTYTPDAGYAGPDSCVLTLTDGDGQSDTATINITVNAEDEITLPGGSSSMDLWSLSLLGSLPLLMRRRRRS